MQIKITVGSSTNRTTVICDDSLTPKQLFAQQKIDYSTAEVFLDGATIDSAQMNKSFKDLGITDTAMLIAVTKTRNAA